MGQKSNTSRGAVNGSPSTALQSSELRLALADVDHYSVRSQMIIHQANRNMSEWLQFLLGFSMGHISCTPLTRLHLISSLLSPTTLSINRDKAQTSPNHTHTLNQQPSRLSQTQWPAQHKQAHLESASSPLPRQRPLQDPFRSASASPPPASHLKPAPPPPLPRRPQEHPRSST